MAVFVSSEGLVPRRMECKYRHYFCSSRKQCDLLCNSYVARSAWSRAFRRPMEIGDLSKNESIDYLVNRRKVKEEEAERLYELVGGRFVDLKFVADESLAGQSFEGRN